MYGRWRGWPLALALVTGLWVMYFAVQGTLADYWDAAFAYNFYYSDLGLLEYIKGIQEALGYFITVPGFIAGALAWLLALAAAVLHFGMSLGGWLRKGWPGYVGLGLGVFAVLAALFGERILSGSAQGGLGLLQIARASWGACSLPLFFGLHAAGLLARWLSGSTGYVPGGSSRHQKLLCWLAYVCCGFRLRCFSSGFRRVIMGITSSVSCR